MFTIIETSHRYSHAPTSRRMDRNFPELYTFPTKEEADAVALELGANPNRWGDEYARTYEVVPIDHELAESPRDHR